MAEKDIEATPVPVPVSRVVAAVKFVVENDLEGEFLAVESVSEAKIQVDKELYDRIVALLFEKSPSSQFGPASSGLPTCPVP